MFGELGLRCVLSEILAGDAKSLPYLPWIEARTAAAALCGLRWRYVPLRPRQSRIAPTVRAAIRLSGALAPAAEDHATIAAVRPVS